MPYGNSGSTKLTADNPVGTSGNPIRVYSLTPLSGATAGITVLRNGTSASGAIYIQETSPVVSSTHTIIFEGGLLFPAGCWFDKGTNVTSIVVEFVEEV
jgi:hypothetical protein